MSFLDLVLGSISSLDIVPILSFDIVLALAFKPCTDVAHSISKVAPGDCATHASCLTFTKLFCPRFSSIRIPARGGLRSIVRANVLAFVRLLLRWLQRPQGRGLFPAALPTSRYAHLYHCLKTMRLTDEASNPLLAISGSRFGSSGSSISAILSTFAAPPHRASWLRVCGSAAVTGRFRDWKLVGSGPYSKCFFRGFSSLAC